MIRAMMFSLLSCVIATSVFAMEKPNGDDNKKILLAASQQSYVSPRVVKRFQEADKKVEKALNSFLAIHPKMLRFLHKENQMIAESEDGAKVAVSCSYHYSHWLNYGDVVYCVTVFDVKTKKPIQRLDCLDKPVCHLKFVGNDRVRAYYKGSEYVGSDTVQEWNLNVGNYSIN